MSAPKPTNLLDFGERVKLTRSVDLIPLIRSRRSLRFV